MMDILQKRTVGDEAEADLNHLPPRVLRSTVEVDILTENASVEQGKPNNCIETTAAKKRKAQAKKKNTKKTWFSDISKFENKSCKGDIDEILIDNFEL